MTYSIKAKLMITVTSATVLGMSAFIAPAEAVTLPPPPQPYILPFTNDYIIKAQFDLIGTNAFEPIQDENKKPDEGLFKMAIKNFIGGVGRICSSNGPNEQDGMKDPCKEGKTGEGTIYLDKYNKPIFLGYEGDACATSVSNDQFTEQKGYFIQCKTEEYGDLDLHSQFFEAGKDPLFAEQNIEDFGSAAIAYTFTQEKEGDILEILSFRLNLEEILGNNKDNKCSTMNDFLTAENCQPVREAVNNLEFIREKNLLGKANSVLCSTSPISQRDIFNCDNGPKIITDGAGRAVLLPNSTATVVEPSMTIGAFVSVGAGLLLKRKTKQQPK